MKFRLLLSSGIFLTLTLLMFRGWPTQALTQSQIVGQIAFYKNSGTSGTGSEEIFLMNADGSDVQPLTDSIGDDHSPRWSPDGQKIVFGSNRDGDYEVYVMDADGSNQRNLTNNPTDADQPGSWSPDGQRIAFYSNRTGNFEIFVVNVDGSNLDQLTFNEARDQGPSWSPDGHYISFDSDRTGDHEIYVMDADGSNVRQLTNNSVQDYGASWSPDCQYLSFNTNRDIEYEIYLMNADGSNPHNLTNNPAQDRDSDWSSDGQYIAFDSFRSGEFEIYVMNADGSNPVQITEGNGGVPAWRPNQSMTPPTCGPFATPMPSPTATITPSPTTSSTTTPSPTSTTTPTLTASPMPTLTPMPTAMPTPGGSEAPVIDSFAINGGALTSTTLNVNLSLSYSDPNSDLQDVGFSNDNFEWSDWQSAETSVGWTLLAGDGIKTVYARARDGAGHISATKSTTITLDTSVEPEYSLTVNQGALYTNQVGVTLRIGAKGGTSEMQVSNDGGFFGAVWESYNSSRAWEITAYDGNVIPRTVYVRYKDNGGNVIATVSDDIILDVKAPTGSITIGRSITESIGAVIINSSASDDLSGVGGMRLSNRSDFRGASWNPFASSKSWTLGANQVVFAQFRDNAGNVSKTYAATTCSTGPSAPQLKKPKAGASVNASEVKLDWNDSTCATTFSLVVKKKSPNGKTVNKMRPVAASQFNTKTLTRGKTYFWRVKVCNGHGCLLGDWWRFKITN